MNYKKKKTKDFFERVAYFLANKPLFITITYFLICLGIGLLIFYFYIVIPQEKSFTFNEKVSKPNRDLFLQVNEKWSEAEVEDENLQEEEFEDNLNNEDISEGELEDILAETLFELYEFKEGNLPTIEERALVWEDLGLGDAQDYKGSFSQNILFLQKLKDELPQE